jgi:hypothetical protein
VAKFQASGTRWLVFFVDGAASVLT